MAATSPLLKNWSGNQVFSPLAVARPATLDALAAAVAGASRVKALGSAHSFNALGQVDASTTLVLLDALDVGPPELVEHARGGASVTVPAAFSYARLASFLAPTRWALANMASLPHISVGGSVATATHGSGAGNANLSAAVEALELVAADGSVRALSRAASPDFAAAVVHLGALGVVTRVTLSLVPAFDVEQVVYENVPWARALGSLPAILSGGYSVSLFTTWAAPLRFEQVWRKRRVRARAPPPDVAGAGAGAGAGATATPPRADAEGEAECDDVGEGEGHPAEWHGGSAATRPLHPIPGVDGSECTAQLGARGAWHARLPHFRQEFTPSAGDELQSEFFVAAGDAPAALAALEPLAADISAVLLVSEVRAVRGDGLALSTAAGRDSVAVHFTWKPEGAAVLALLPRVEAALAPFYARPHWGKLSPMLGDARALERAYGARALDAFRATRRALDPSGKFANDFLDAAGLTA